MHEIVVLGTLAALGKELFVQNLANGRCEQ